MLLFGMCFKHLRTIRYQNKYLDHKGFTLYFFWPLWQSFRSCERPRTNCNKSAFLVFKFSRSPVNCCIKHGIFFRCSCKFFSSPSSELEKWKILPLTTGLNTPRRLVYIYWLADTDTQTPRGELIETWTQVKKISNGRNKQYYWKLRWVSG